MSLVDDIKTSVKKSGTNKSKFLYFRPGTKVRVRFLQDMDEGMKIPFHDSYALGINVPCQELFDRECGHCDNDELRHRDQYMWSVWDHDAKEVKLLMGAVSSVSPVPTLVAMYDTYGTLTDRDYVITKNGQGTTSTFSVVPMDKVKFRNEKAKPFSESKALAILDKAFPDDESDEEEEDKPSKKKGKKDAGKNVGKAKLKAKKQPEPEEEDEDDEAEESEYEGMSAVELFKECRKRGLDVKPKKDAEYYIEKLEADDDEEEDEGDEW